MYYTVFRTCRKLLWHTHTVDHEHERCWARTYELTDEITRRYFNETE